jgi:membrane protein implicated in regulation of membrane protease activity
LAVAERGPLIVVVDRGTGALATTAFVLAVVALVIGGFGAATLVLSAAVPWWLGTAFLFVGVVFAVGVRIVVGRVRRARARPLSGYRPVAVFDRAHRIYVDADGTVVSPLDQVRFERRGQATSSSPALVVVTPGGTRILKRGNPFNGGIGNLDAVLTAAVFGRAR